MTKKLLALLLIVNYTVFAQQSYYNDVDLTKTGLQLKNELATKIIATHTNPLDYIWNATQATDLNPSNSSNVLLIYGWENGSDSDCTNDLERDVNDNGGNVCDWNREHTYPNSLGTPDLDSSGKNMTAYSDAHNLRASDVQRNGQRGNKLFVDSSGNSKTVGSYWYPGDEWKGDVARIVMYMYLRYGSQCLPNNVTVGSTNSVDSNMIDLLLEWNAEDPVSQYEDNRNNYHENTSNTYAQGNRNPFIDEPYLAKQIWGGPEPENRWGILSVENYNLRSIELYPNPASGNTLTIQSIEPVEVQFFNMLGKSILNLQQVRSNESVDIGNLPKGMYFVQLSNDTGSITKKFIKQ
ncbi:endonuclease [Urechidicola sp. KH5]